MKAFYKTSVWWTAVLLVSTLYLSGCGKKNNPVVTPPPPPGNSNPFGGGGFGGGGGVTGIGGGALFTVTNGTFYEQSGYSASNSTATFQNLQLSYYNSSQPTPTAEQVSLAAYGVLYLSKLSQTPIQLVATSPLVYLRRTGQLQGRLQAQGAYIYDPYFQTQRPIQVSVDFTAAGINGGNILDGSLRINVDGVQVNFVSQGR